MTYNYISFLPLIHHQVSIIHSPIVLMTLKNGLFLIIFSLNTSKTTLLNHIPSPNYFHPFLIDTIVISPFPTASNLGVFLILLFPSFLILLRSLNLHYNLFRIRKIRKSITVSLIKTLVNSLVLSRIDYCSSILINIPLSFIYPINRVIHSPICTTYNLRILDHSSTSS